MGCAAFRFLFQAFIAASPAANAVGSAAEPPAAAAAAAPAAKAAALRAFLLGETVGVEIATTRWAPKSVKSRVIKNPVTR